MTCLLRSRRSSGVVGNLRAALNNAALAIEQQISTHGQRPPIPVSGKLTGRTVLSQELELVCSSALAQGWTVKTNSETTLRLRSTRGKTYTLTKATPAQTRVELRRFAAELRAGGLRINRSVRHPVAESPFGE